MHAGAALPCSSSSSSCGGSGASGGKGSKGGTTALLHYHSSTASHHHHRSSLSAARRGPRAQMMRWLVLASCLTAVLPWLYHSWGSYTIYTAKRMLDRTLRTTLYYQGRQDLVDPSPKCCQAEGCLARDRGRHAIITSLRTDAYLPLVQELACSVRRTNPRLPFLVYTLPGDLAPWTEDAVRSFAELRYWRADLRLPSYTNDGRFSLNWIKLRAWELEGEWDAVLLVDSDVTILGDLSALFTLPAAFAAAPDQDEVSVTWWFGGLGRIQGGFLFLRPCRAVAEHMIALARADRLLQFQYDYAEQDFLDWYFKFDRWLLPLDFNSVVPITPGGATTLAGSPVKSLHFTRHKPFVRDATVPHHRHLCLGSSGGSGGSGGGGGGSRSSTVRAGSSTSGGGSIAGGIGVASGGARGAAAAVATATAVEAAAAQAIKAAALGKTAAAAAAVKVVAAATAAAGGWNATATSARGGSAKAVAASEQAHRLKAASTAASTSAVAAARGQGGGGGGGGGAGAALARAKQAAAFMAAGNPAGVAGSLRSSGSGSSSSSEGEQRELLMVPEITRQPVQQLAATATATGASAAAAVADTALAATNGSPPGNATRSSSHGSGAISGGGAVAARPASSGS